MIHQVSSKIHNRRIEICGGIASGKTTLATLIQCNSIETIYESFQKNPFWQAFYSNPGKFIFETEISFMLLHYHQIKKTQPSNKITICDFSFFLDVAYAKVGLQGSKLKAFLTVYEEIERELPPLSLLIYLNCDAKTELERITNRGRDIEKSITLEFLEVLNVAIKRQVENAKKSMRVISIDSAQKNFAEDKTVKEEVASLILNSVQSVIM